MGEILCMVERSTEGGYIGRALGHPILAEADTRDELRAAVRHAVRSLFDEAELPAVVRLRMSRDVVVMI